MRIRYAAGAEGARRAQRAWRLKRQLHIGSSCDSLELLAPHHARLLAPRLESRSQRRCGLRRPHRRLRRLSARRAEGHWQPRGPPEAPRNNALPGPGRAAAPEPAPCTPIIIKARAGDRHRSLWRAAPIDLDLPLVAAERALLSAAALHRHGRTGLGQPALTATPANARTGRNTGREGCTQRVSKRRLSGDHDGGIGTDHSSRFGTGMDFFSTRGRPPGDSEV